MSAFLFWSAKKLFLSAQHSQEPRIVRLWWGYVAGVGFLAIAAVYVFPGAFG